MATELARLVIYLTPEEKEMIAQIAREHRLSASSWVRMTLAKGLETLTSKAKSKETT